jgi:hypothetical protein
VGALDRSRLLSSGTYFYRRMDSASLPVAACFLVAVLVVHPVMNQKLPWFRADLLRSWRIYAGIALVAIVNLIELKG